MILVLLVTFFVNLIILNVLFSLQGHHEQQSFLPAPQPNEDTGHARDCHGGHGQCARRRQVAGLTTSTCLCIAVKQSSPRHLSRSVVAL